MQLCISQVSIGLCVLCAVKALATVSPLRKAKLRQLWLSLSLCPHLCYDLPAAGSVIAILFLCAKNASG